MYKKLFFIIFFSGILLLPFISLGAEKKYPKALNFSLRTMDNQRVELDSLIGKGPIVITFWATWCTHCCVQLDRIKELYKRYKEQGFEILAISQDGPRTLSKVKPLVKSRGWEFKILLDPEGEVKRLYRIFAIPQTLLIDKEGRIRRHYRGFKVGDEVILEKEINALLEEFKQKTPKPERQK